MLPNSVLKISKLLPTREIRQLASVGEIARKVVREILAAHRVQDETDKDIVDILSKSRNILESAALHALSLVRARLTGQIQDDEIELQFMLIVSSSSWYTSDHSRLSLRSFLLAGHETTASTLSWLLYELAAHPEHQAIIREEVKHSYHDDYDSLPFLNAAIKVSVPTYFVTFVD